MQIRTIFSYFVVMMSFGLSAHDGTPRSSLAYEYSLAIDNIDRCTKPEDLRVLLKHMHNTYTYIQNGQKESTSASCEPIKEAHDFLIRASYKQVQFLHQTVLNVMHDLDRALSYWKEQKRHPWRYRFAKNPRKWFVPKKQKQELEENISHLTIIYNYHAQFLGQLNYQLQVWPGIISRQEQYAWALRSIDISQAFLHDRAVSASEQSVPVAYDVLVQRMHDTLQESITYPKKIMRTISAKPNFLVRGWIPYSTSACATLGATTYMICNYDKIVAGIHHGQKALEKFYTNQIKQVYMRMKAVLWDDIPHRHPAESESSRWWRYNPFSGGALGNSLDYMLCNGEAKRHLRMMQLTFAMASAVPACYCAHYAGKGLLYGVKFLQRNPYNFECIRSWLREIQRVLNRYSGSSAQKMSFEDQGLLCYYVYRLRTQIGYVPTSMYYAFDEDLQELSSHEASIAQKLGTANRMLVAYPFLMPHA